MDEMPFGRGYHKMVYFDHFIYVIGGWNGTYQKSVIKYDLRNKVWTSTASLNYGRYGHGAVIYQK